MMCTTVKGQMLENTHHSHVPVFLLLYCLTKLHSRNRPFMVGASILFVEGVLTPSLWLFSDSCQSAGTIGTLTCDEAFVMDFNWSLWYVCRLWDAWGGLKHHLQKVLFPCLNYFKCGFTIASVKFLFEMTKLWCCTGSGSGIQICSQKPRGLGPGDSSGWKLGFNSSPLPLFSILCVWSRRAGETDCSLYQHSRGCMAGRHE